MKLCVGVIVLFVALQTVTSKDSSESSESMEAFVTEQAELCKKNTNATDKDVEDMMNRVTPTTQVAKCLSECVLDKLGIIKNGKLVPDELTKMVDDEMKSSNGKTIKEALKEIIDECKMVTHADKCEAAALILACLNAAAKKRGFDNSIL